MTLVDLLTFATMTSGLGYLVALYRRSQPFKYLLKPLTMFWIILIALSQVQGTGGAYGWLILIGLLCSVVGDVLLMLPNRFMQGLIAFFVAHLLYMNAFAQIGGYGSLNWVAGVALLVVGLGFRRLLIPGVQTKGGSNLATAVSLYIVVISLMLYGAIGTAQPLALAGAGLFYLSDGQLAINRFHRPFWWADYGVMSTYYLAQFCLALSIGAF